MVISGLPSICFTTELQDLVISGITDTILVSIRVDGTEALYERYYPDSSGIVRVRDLNQLISPFFLRPNLSTSFLEIKTFLDIQIQITSAGTTTQVLNSKVYEGPAQGDITLSGNDKYMFLTRYRKKRTNISRSEILGFIHHGQTITYAVAYMLNGIPKYTKGQYIQEVAGLTRLMNVSLSSVAATLERDIRLAIAPDQILYYEFFSIYNGEEYDRIRFVNDLRFFPEENNFIYRNCFGIPETISFTGADESTIDLKGTYSYVDGIYSKYDTEPVKSHKINSGYINQGMLDSIEDLLLSDRVFTILAGELDSEVVITGCDIVRKKPSNEPIACTVTFRDAARKHFKFVKAGAVPRRIFDKSFNHTFD